MPKKLIQFMAWLMVMSLVGSTVQSARVGVFSAQAAEDDQEIFEEEIQTDPITKDIENQGPFLTEEEALTAFDILNQVRTQPAEFTPPVVKISGIDLEAARANQVDKRVMAMLIRLGEQHAYQNGHLKIARITKNYTTDPKQFSKETIYQEDDQPNISAHHTGQAFDISEIDMFQCSTKTLFGSKKTPPRSIKVAWQTKEGLAASGDSPELDPTSFHSLTGSISQDLLFDIIAERSDLETFKLPGGFTFEDLIKYAGRSEIKNTTGFTPPLAQTDTIGFTIGQGRSAIAQSTGGQVSPSGLVGQDKTELSKNFVMSVIENKFRLPEGSLRGKTPDEIITNFGKRQLEHQLGLESGQLNSQPSTWRPIVKARVTQYQDGGTADLALGWPGGTLDELDRNPTKAFKILGATKFADLTKMTGAAAKEFLKSIRKDQPIQSIPLVGVDLPVAIAYHDAQALFGDDDQKRGQAAERLAVDTLAGLLNKNKFLGNAYLNLNGQDILAMFKGTKKPDEVIGKIGASVVESQLDLPIGSITKTLADLKKKPAPVPPEAWGQDTDGNGYPDAYDNPAYYTDRDGNGLADIWDSPSARQNRLDQVATLLVDIGQGRLQELGRDTKGYSQAQAQEVGSDYLKTKLASQLNHELGLSNKLTEKTLGLMKITDQDIKQLLTGDFSTFKNIEDKIGSLKLAEALQIPEGSLYGYIKGFIKDDELMVASALEKLRGISGTIRPKLDGFGSGAPEEAFVKKALQELAGRGQTNSPEPSDPSNAEVVSQLKLLYRQREQNKSLSGQLQQKIGLYTTDALDRWFEWDADKAKKYGQLSPNDLFGSLAALTDKDKANDDKGKAILKDFVSHAFDSKGFLAPGSLAELIDNPKKAPETLLTEASKRIDIALGAREGTFQAVYVDGDLNFNVKIDQLSPSQQAIVSKIAEVTKMVQLNGQFHPDAVKFLNGDTQDAFKGWGIASFVDQLNQGNPFGDQYKLSYDEIRAVYFGDKKTEQVLVEQIEADIGQAVADPDERRRLAIELAEPVIRDQRLWNRNLTNGKIMDITLAKQGLKIPQGFSYAMLYGDEQARVTALKQVALAEVAFGSDQELGQKLGLPVQPGTVELIQKYALGELKSYDEFRARLADKYGHKTDEILRSLGLTQFFNDRKLQDLTGIDIVPGTAAAISRWAFGQTDFEALKKNLETVYTGRDFISFELSKFADKTFGLPAGTSFQMYQYYQQYQNLYANYQRSLNIIKQMGGPQASQYLKTEWQAAGQQFQAQSMILYVQALDLITGGKISRLSSPIDSALGLPPGTIFNAALAYLSGNPVGAGIVIAMAIFGFGKTTCPDLEKLAQQKVHQVLQEIMDNSPDQAKEGTLPDGSLTPLQLITWGQNGQYPAWIQDLIQKALDIWDPERRFGRPVVGKVGFFTGETYREVIHVGY